jgi:threonine synthase
MGDGCTIAEAWKGFEEFYKLGLVDSAPCMLGVQAAGASGIHDAFHNDNYVHHHADTVADSIAVGRPRNTFKVCRALEESGGTTITVSDEEILDAEKLLGSRECIYAEPAGAVPVAGVQKALACGIIEEDETVCVLVIGHGLKDTEIAMQAGDYVASIEPTLDDVRDLYDAST